MSCHFPALAVVWKRRSWGIGLGFSLRGRGVMERGMEIGLKVEAVLETERKKRERGE